ncbi:MAG: hemolysin III family protein [Bdellovibrio sp.]|nr:hemolysin III family protein [Bdellovibrio sp.]
MAIQDGEKFNTVSHLIGGLLAACGVALLLYLAVEKHDVSRILTCLIYGVSTVLIYVLSVLYHSAERGPQKAFFQKLDYIGIYFKIAGNYTPYMILAIRGFPGYSVLAVVWSLAAVGILVELIFEPRGHRIVPNIIYLTMSATVVPVLNHLFHAVPPQGFALIMLGFLSYAVGFGFFLFDGKIKHGHGIWHMFVLGGSACQYLCLLLYVI